MLQIPVQWDPPSWVRTDVTTRNGGVSLAPWNTFNLGLSTGDNPDHVAENRKRWCQRMGVERYIPLYQEHGIQVAQLTPMKQGPITADAALTVYSGIPCAVLTADCLPIFLCSQKQHCVAAVHAGWRGLVKGIIQHTCSQMQSYAPLMAWVGPGCCGRCYEVQQDVYDAAISACPSLKTTFQPNPVLGNGHYFFDLQKAAGKILEEVGVSKIYFSPYCTKESVHLLYSHRGASKTGRQGSAIWMTEE